MAVGSFGLIECFNETAFADNVGTNTFCIWLQSR